MGKHIAILLSGLALSSISVAQSLPPLTQAELEAELKRSVRWDYQNASSAGKIEHTADGKAWVEGRAGTSRFYDTGRYVVRDGSVCYTWTRIRDGKEGCFKFSKRDGQLISLDADGKEEGWRKEIK